MCGFTGLFDPSGRVSEQDLDELVQRMSGTLAHRGPDDSGTWLDPEHGLALGFRRLSILDLTQDGHQPMLSPLGRYVIAFNGEVYNYADVRATLEQVAHDVIRRTRGHSDTATMLAAFEVWGIPASLKKFAGMFAMAVWDRQDRTLTLARDRIGEKPLYYGWLKAGGFVFGSELKSLRAHPDFNTELSVAALNVYFKRAFIPAPLSIYEGVFKLFPGTTLTLSADDFAQRRLPVPKPYWSLEEVARNGLENRDENLSDEEAVRQFDQLLRKVVQREMVADVPLGAFLSGGIDSSLVVAIMQQLASQPVKTFSIGFENQRFNEAPYAAAVAAHLGTDHTEQYVTDREAMDVIPLLASIYDEPFADSSQIPTYLVSRIARQEVTVSLTGDGGDEIFGGYNSYLLLSALWDRLGKLPAIVRDRIPSLLDGMSRLPAQRSLFEIGAHVPGIKTAMSDPSRVYRIASHLRKDSSLLSVYAAFVTNDSSPLRRELVDEAALGQFRGPGSDLLRQMPAFESVMFWDALGVLPDDMLTKVDRASMATSLETRAPFVDHEIVEYSWQLPLHLKVRDGRGKWIVRKALDNYVPSHLIDRPKRGFGIPVREWLTGPLKGWVDELLSPSHDPIIDYLDQVKISNLWTSYQNNGMVSNAEIWSLVMLHEWMSEAQKFDLGTIVQASNCLKSSKK